MNYLTKHHKQWPEWSIGARVKVCVGFEPNRLYRILYNQTGIVEGKVTLHDGMHYTKVRFGSRIITCHPNSLMLERRVENAENYRYNS